MQVIKSPRQMFELTLAMQAAGKKIGLVPTMGALHSGHYSLVSHARSYNDFLVVSIFVNPLQFNNTTDLAKYPRTLDADLAALNQLGVDAVFVPEVEDMYPQKPLVSVDFGIMGNVLEGEFRPGHFSGVGVVVGKLFHYINPTNAYFGLKDLQQYLLIRRMVLDLGFPVNVVGLPIVREESGLAMSSRNVRLSDHGREVAANIYQGLLKARESWQAGADVLHVKKAALDFYQEIEEMEVEYLEIVNPDNLESVFVHTQAPVVMCVAAFVEGVRLIDNLYLRQD